MKRAFIFLALLGLTHPLWSADNEIQKVITELEFKWAEAQKLGHAKVVAPMLAEVILRSHQGRSVGALFNE